jgi:hypothetical protein
MTGKKKMVQREAPQGEKMIELKIRFWTNDLADKEGMIRPKHAWSSGVVRMERNESHDIVPQKPIVFHSLMDLNAIIEKVLISHGISLHVSRKMGKYFDED